MEPSDFIFDSLHFIIHINDSAGTVQKLAADFLVTIHFFNILFISELMFQCSPEIHSIGTDLDLRAHGRFSLGEEHRDFHDHVIAAVTVWLGIFDIIFSLYENDIILFQKTFFQFIDIRYRRERNRSPEHRRCL